MFQNVIEYCLCYGKNKDKIVINKIDPVNENLRSLNDAPSGLETRRFMGYTIYYNPVSGDIQPKIDYDVNGEFTDLNKIYTDDQDLIKQGYVAIRPTPRNNVAWRWRWGMDTLIERKSELEFRKNKNGTWVVEFGQKGFNAPRNYQEYGTGTAELKRLFEGKEIFSKPKSVEFIDWLLKVGTAKNDIVLDFFSGSCTTAHSIMQLNALDGGERKFIMIQLPEETDVTSEAYKAGYLNICQIGKERIRRAGKKIITDFQEQLEKRDTPLDIGFRVYKVDSTNMKDVYYHPSDLTQTTLETLIDNVKDDRTPEDLLTQVMLDLGLELTLPIEIKEYSGHKVFFVQGNTLIACFEKIKDFSIVDDLARLEPLKVVLKDSSFVDDKDRINFENRFKRFSPDTQITVI